MSDVSELAAKAAAFMVQAGYSHGSFVPITSVYGISSGSIAPGMKLKTRIGRRLPGSV